MAGSSIIKACVDTTEILNAKDRQTETFDP